jgi:hypothetical protein
VDEKLGFVGDLLHCARCGENHSGIIWKKFVIPIVDDDETTWDWWAMCPINNDPILLRHIEEKKDT